MLDLELSGFRLMIGTVACAFIGLLLPGAALDRLRSYQHLNYRNAFPDFMDLLVVCVESGQSLPAALDRVSKEIVQFCPGLGANLHIVTLELRAGRTLSDALEGLQGRTALEEVRSLQLLLKQSEELGASIAPTLRVFAEEMRNKRFVSRWHVQFPHFQRFYPFKLLYFAARNNAVPSSAYIKRHQQMKRLVPMACKC